MQEFAFLEGRLDMHMDVIFADDGDIMCVALWTAATLPSAAIPV
jgi:hypothetical protein